MNTQVNKSLLAGLVALAGSLAGCQAFDPPGKSQVRANASASLKPASAVGSNAPGVQLVQRPRREEVEPARASQRYASANMARVTFAAEGSDFDPCVSRDGQVLVFASTQHRATADIYLKRVNSKVLTQLTTEPSDDVMPELSPDGQRIAFASNRSGNWDVYVMPVTGGSAVQVTSDLSDELHPSWSPDGKDLVFCRLGEASGRWEMWVTDVGNPSTSNFIGYGLFPQWNPVAGAGEGTGEQILFQLSRDRGKRTFGLWVMDYQDGVSGNLREIASSASSALINPAWSPDGRWIAYAEVPASGEEAPRPRGSKLPAEASLWMIGADGTGRVNLASGPGASLMPTWSGDQRLFFVSNRAGGENIWSMDMKNALLAATGSMPSAPAFANAPEPAVEVEAAPVEHE